MYLYAPIKTISKTLRRSLVYAPTDSYMIFENFQPQKMQ